MSKEGDLKNYAATWISDDIRFDYEQQLERKWGAALDKVISAFAEARANQAAVFIAVRKKKQAEADLILDLALLALSVATAGTMGWIGATIQRKLANSLSSSSSMTKNVKMRLVRIEQKEMWIDGGWKFQNVPVPSHGAAAITETVYDNKMGEFFGGFIKDAGERSIDEASAKVARRVPNFHQGLDEHLKTIVSIEKFREGIRNTFRSHVSKGSAAIMSLARTIRESDDSWGKIWLDRENGDAKRAEASIRRQLQLVREKLARDWFYYGHDPNLAESELARIIERELWAFWTLSRKPEMYAKFGDRWVKNKGRDIHVMGEGLGEIFKIDDLIVKRLATLGVAAPQTVGQALSRAARNRSEPTPSRGIPVKNVHGDIDTPSEWRELLGWAKNSPPQIIEKNKIPAKKRVLVNLENITKVWQ